MKRYLPQRIDIDQPGVTLRHIQDAYVPDLSISAENVDLETMNVSHPALFQNQKHWDYFERLRREAPVHYCPDSQAGPYWSITRFDDILKVDSDFSTFSSDARFGGIEIGGQPLSENEPNPPMFLQMDPPDHTRHRKAVNSSMSPNRLSELEKTIRDRVVKIFDGLPRNEEFDWVESVSIELTSQMLATLFDVPQEDRLKLVRWSDIAGNTKNPDVVSSQMEAVNILMGEFVPYFANLWVERAAQPPKPDLVSMLAHHEVTKDMISMPLEFLGTFSLLTVGGNDTTRNSISGGFLALHDNPGEFEKLKNNTDLIPSAVSEIIRWQTPLMHMKRTAVKDVEFGGQTIRQGDQVVMWYVSGNRDQVAIPGADRFQIDRPNPRRHASFGFGIHRCMGNRLAEMQLRITLEEFLKRVRKFEVTERPTYVNSNFVSGISSLKVRLAD